MKAVCEVNGISFSYGSKLILDGVSFCVQKKEVVGIIGRNGSGKSTLFNVISGFLSPQRGSVHIGENEIKSMSRIEKARTISYVQQHKEKLPSYYTVEDFVLEGRRPFRRFGFYTKEDYALLDEVISQCDLENFRKQEAKNLSGGEMQRCLFAKALMKRSPLYLFDEPCSALDIKFQNEFFRLVSKINGTTESSFLITIHDINLAVRNCGRILVLNDGKIAFDGSADSLDTRTLEKAFDTKVSDMPDGGTKYFYY